ncbi:hypothetical protein H4R21_004984, partial [Coemansia helicoidea]
RGCRAPRARRGRRYARARRCRCRRLHGRGDRRLGQDDRRAARRERRPQGIRAAARVVAQPAQGRDAHVDGPHGHGLPPPHRPARRVADARGRRPAPRRANGRHRPPPAAAHDAVGQVPDHVVAAAAAEPVRRRWLPRYGAAQPRPGRTAVRVPRGRVRAPDRHVPDGPLAKPPAARAAHPWRVPARGPSASVAAEPGLRRSPRARCRVRRSLIRRTLRRRPAPPARDDARLWLLGARRVPAPPGGPLRRRAARQVL